MSDHYELRNSKKENKIRINSQDKPVNVSDKKIQTDNKKITADYNYANVSDKGMRVISDIKPEQIKNGQHVQIINNSPKNFTQNSIDDAAKDLLSKQPKSNIIVNGNKSLSSKTSVGQTSLSQSSKNATTKSSLLKNVSTKNLATASGAMHGVGNFRKSVIDKGVSVGSESQTSGNEVPMADKSPGQMILDQEIASRKTKDLTELPNKIRKKKLEKTQTKLQRTNAKIKTLNFQQKSSLSSNGRVKVIGGRRLKSAQKTAKETTQKLNRMLAKQAAKQAMQQVSKKTVKATIIAALPMVAKIGVLIVENLPLIIALFVSISAGLAISLNPTIRTTTHIPSVSSFYMNGKEPTDEEMSLIQDNVKKQIWYSPSYENKDNILISQRAVDEMHKIYEKKKDKISTDVSESSEMTSSAVFVNNSKIDDISFTGFEEAYKYTVPYTYIGTRADGATYIKPQDQEVPVESTRKYSCLSTGQLHIKYQIGDDAITQIYVIGAPVDTIPQYLGMAPCLGSCESKKRYKQIIGWSFDENATDPEFSKYQKIDDVLKNILCHAADANTHDVWLYPVWGDKTTAVLTEDIGVVSETEINNNLKKYFTADDLMIKYAYVDEKGETVYSTIKAEMNRDKDGKTIYRAYDETSLIKAILSMATVITQNDDYRFNDSLLKDTSKQRARVYVDYCKKIMEDAMNSVSNFSVKYEVKKMEGTKGTALGKSWTDSNGVEYIADGARLSCIITVYIDVSADSLMDNDDTTYIAHAGNISQSQAYTMTGENSNPDAYYFNGWDKKSKEWVTEYLEYDEETFLGMYNVVYPPKDVYLDSDDKVANTVFSVLTQNGYSAEAACAIIANLTRETVSNKLKLNYEKIIGANLEKTGEDINYYEEFQKNHMADVIARKVGFVQAPMDELNEYASQYGQEWQPGKGGIDAVIQTNWLLEQIGNGAYNCSGFTNEVNTYRGAFEWQYFTLPLEEFKQLKDIRRATIAYAACATNLACPDGVDLETTSGIESITKTETVDKYETVTVPVTIPQYENIRVVDEIGRFGNVTYKYITVKVGETTIYREEQQFVGTEEKTYTIPINNELNERVKLAKKRFGAVTRVGGFESGDVEGYIAIAAKIAADDTHGYDNHPGKNLFNPDVDCGTYIYQALSQAGVIDESRGSTAFYYFGYNIEPPDGWEKMNFTDVEDLQRGDVLMRSTNNGSDFAGHTEIYIGDYKCLGAHQNHDGKTGDSSGNEVNEGSYWDADWNIVARYTKGTSSKKFVYTQPRYYRFFSNADVGTMIPELNGVFGNSFVKGYVVTSDPGLPVGSVIQIKNDTVNSIEGAAVNSMGMEIDEEKNYYVVVSNNVNTANVESYDSAGNAITTPEKIGDDYIIYIWTSSLNNAELEKYPAYQTPQLVKTLFTKHKKLIENAEELCEFMASANSVQ